jgi:hypothetical protein
MDEIDHAFGLLIEIGLTSSEAAFSRIWLGADGGYFTHLRSTGAEPSREACANLGRKFVEAASLVARFQPLTAEQQRHRNALFRLGAMLSVKAIKPRNRAI